MRILHLSDLHCGLQGAPNAYLASEALIDVARLHGEVSIDVVIWSGDLANAGKAPEFEDAIGILIAPLLDRLDLPRSRFVMVAGNHDIDRDKIDRIYEAGLKATLIDNDTVTAMQSNPLEVAKALERLSDWTAFHDRFYGEQRPEPSGDLAFVHRFEIRNLTVGVAALNTAWRATGRPESEDRQHLLLGDHQLISALDAIRQCDVRIAAFHHPIEWLSPFDHDVARAELERRGILVFSGHEHVPDPTGVISSRGRAVYSRSGCLYGGTNYRNGFSVLDVDVPASTVTVSMRTWFNDRREFDAALDRAPGGRIQIPFPSPSQGSIALAPYSRVQSSLAAVAHETRLASLGVGEREPLRVSDIVVEPRLYPLPFAQAAAAAALAKGRGGKADHVVRSDPNATLSAGSVLIVSGDRSSGVTNTLLWLLETRYSIDEKRLPVYVRFEPLPGTDPTGRLIRRAVSNLGIDIHPESELPLICVALDDVTASNSLALERLAQYVTSHQDNLFIFGCHDVDHVALREALDRVGVRTETVLRAHLEGRS